MEAVTVAEGCSAGLRVLEMPVGAVQSSGVAAREAGQDPERVRGAVRANVQASEEPVANRGSLDGSPAQVQVDLAHLRASGADSVPVGGLARAVAA